MAKDFVAMQVQGIDANPESPVHAGLAKFLKEHKAWNDKWAPRRVLIVRLEEMGGHYRDECPPEKAWRRVEHRAEYATFTAKTWCAAIDPGSALDTEDKILRRGE